MRSRLWSRCAARAPVSRAPVDDRAHRRGLQPVDSARGCETACATGLRGGSDRLLAARAESGYIAIVSQGFPQLVRVSNDVVRPDNSRSFAERTPVLCQVRMLN